jgi:hypothetical protein
MLSNAVTLLDETFEIQICVQDIRK